MDVNTGKEIKTARDIPALPTASPSPCDGYLLVAPAFAPSASGKPSAASPSPSSKGHNGPGTAAAFAKDGRSFYTGSPTPPSSAGIRRGRPDPPAQVSAADWNDTWQTLATENGQGTRHRLEVRRRRQ